MSANPLRTRPLLLSRVRQAGSTRVHRARNGPSLGSGFSGRTREEARTHRGRGELEYLLSGRDARRMATGDLLRVMRACHMTCRAWRDAMPFGLVHTLHLDSYFVSLPRFVPAAGRDAYGVHRQCVRTWWKGQRLLPIPGRRMFGAQAGDEEPLEEEEPLAPDTKSTVVANESLHIECAARAALLPSSSRDCLPCVTRVLTLQLRGGT